jgi:hypothetical protein
MFRLILLTTSIFLFPPCRSSAQTYVRDGTPWDSTFFDFNNANDTVIALSTDTSSMHVWQIGNTIKSFFSNPATARAIMTDTANTYSVGLNDWFVVPINFIPGSINRIVSFRHKYQTTPGKDGCLVEYSNDQGITWQNVSGDCNGDSTGGTFNNVLTENLYGPTDTLENGTPAFSGTSNGWQYSRVQFFMYIPVKTTQPTCDMESVSLIRFRFVSDSTAENLDGWIIDNITVERDYYSGVASHLKYRTLDVHPNPSVDGLVSFPVLTGQEKFRLMITNSLGMLVYSGVYVNRLDLSASQVGLYCYHVTNGTEEYSGKLLIR